MKNLGSGMDYRLQNNLRLKYEVRRLRERIIIFNFSTDRRISDNDTSDRLISSDSYMFEITNIMKARSRNGKNA
jgi:hypothetical protein